jgi:RNA polymerase sigma factor (sigma-70 family)
MSPEANAEIFATTHWSVVLAAKDNSTPAAREALERLCRTYWYPLYSYIRRAGYHADDAQDLTQSFFARLLASNSLASVLPEKGKFRSFLLTALNHSLVDEARRAKAGKRGGGQTLFSLDDDEAESRYQLEPASELTAERIFDQRWAVAVLDHAIARLREEFIAAGKERHFELLREFLSRESSDGAYAGTATQLQTSPGTVAVLVHRLRQRYRELVREEVANTVSAPGEVEEEMQYLFEVLGRGNVTGS